MSHIVVFLRGMNVGGHRITNDELVGVVQDLGFASVVAFQASGNVLLDGGGVATQHLELVLEEGLAAALGYSVPTIARTADEIQSVLAADPFADATHLPIGKPQIAFLKNPLSQSETTEIEARAPAEDHLVVIGREVYWWPDGGISDSEIDWTTLNRAYGPMTMRTRNTIDRIAKKLTDAAS